ncbi:MAG: glycosyltransferase family 4 protein [Solirubrobacteraceae bacterium]
MRLLYLSADPGVPVFGGKGASVHVRALASAFDALGHEVIVVSPRLEPGENAIAASVRVAEIPAVRPRECATQDEVIARAEYQARALTELARRENVDAIYERYSLTSFAGARASAELGIPLALEVNAPLRAEEERFRELRHEVAAVDAERETFAAARRIFTVSASLAHWLSANGVNAGRVEVMGNAPPARAFAPRAPVSEHSEVVVGFAGGLKPWHGVETLLRGFERALERGAKIRLEVLGTGPAEDLVDQASLREGRLRRLGQLPHEQALGVLERWDVGAAPFNAVDGFYFSPLKLFEYMAAGLCPVVSDVGELAQIVERGRAGMVVPAGDAGALAEALVALDRDRPGLRELGAAAQAAVRQRPTWVDNARRIMAALDGLGPR